MMEHENAYTLMMETLDGELADDRKYDLEAHLRVCPACAREWQALAAVDMLFRQAPVLAPAADFTQRTLARLPNRRYRVWMISIMYSVLLLGGALPMLIGFWIYSKLGTVLVEPTMWQAVWQAIGRVFQIAGTVLSALLSGVGEFVVQQPAVMGWLLVMVGLISLWSGLFRQLVFQPTPVQVGRITS